MKTPSRYENAKWEDVPKTIQVAIEEMKNGGKGIYIHGAVGTGKTHICYAISQNHSIRLWNVVDLMHEIRKDFDRSSYDKRRIDDELTGNDYSDLRRTLILDDIGAERATDWVAETLYRIINHQYMNKAPTIFTSNCSLQELAERIGERSASRIVEMCNIITLTGVDRRINK